MPLPIQQGSVADKLRNFLRLVGRAGTTLDEVVTPIVNVQDLDQPPWRTNEANWMVHAGALAVAANFAGCGVRVPARVNGVAVVRKAIISNVTGSARRYFIQIADFPQTSMGATYSAIAATDIEHPGTFLAGALPQPLPPLGFIGAYTPIATFYPIGRVTVPADVSMVLDLDVALRSGVNGDTTLDGAALLITIESLAQDNAITFVGTWYPDAP